ncbi:PREDICTED: adenylate cyclase type 9 [Rhagoletis zephyria]|uniref:adenylate cyclase type 9 n=1 Tax=Rhagoletis zephyria TaxID=28612 RepID=UPI00081126B2|nr:PREDICTED: adenylate cyclase type 9 [Rhagoletis zephyria]
MPPGVLVNDSRSNSTDDIQIALAPHIQTYLSQTGRRHSCCSVMLPVAFERAASKSWLDPKFDSAVLEGQFQTSVFPHIRMRYRFALSYILLCSLSWFLYFLIDGGSENYWRPISSSFSMLSLIIIAAMSFTHWDMYRAYRTFISALTAIVLCASSLAFVIFTGRAFSPLGHFSICVSIVLLIYTALPMPLWMSAFIAVAYSALFEVASHIVVGNSATHGAATECNNKIMLLRILLHICVHLVGVHVLIMNVVRMRGMFMKVGQNLLVRRQLEMEKQLKEKMIHSVMPPKVADMLLNEGGAAGIDTKDGVVDPDSHYVRPRTSNDLQTLFRPFHMHSMDNVSILFADIVGFTKMSSTKTAEQLVEILNDLFERFDDLCTLNGCEKISTLGDCYYCVSGCPEPRADHAICCVEMGLGMIDAMRCFDAQRHEGVKMRVGVHTGTVLCGIVGTRRVKFDVWSNDVSLANKMESSGKPEQVHISEETSNFLGDAYLLEEGEEVFGHRTYFVVGRRKDVSRANSLSPSIPGNYSGSRLQLPGIPGQPTPLSLSATNISVIQPNVPPASPVGQLSSSLNPSPILSMRPRLTSLSMKLRKKSQSRERDIERGVVHADALGAPPVVVIRERPKIIITTKSLPGSLDSADEADKVNDGCCNGLHVTNGSAHKAHSAEETGRTKIKLKVCKVPRFFKKIEGIVKHTDKSSCADVGNGGTSLKSAAANSDETVAFIEPNGYHQLSVVVESSKPSLTSNTLEIPQKPMLQHAATSTGISHNFVRSPDGSCCSPGQFSMFDDIIDIRSYISQSRSDISPFGRSGSYRSQCGRSGKSETSPVPRPRASTLTTATAEKSKDMPATQPLIVSGVPFPCALTATANHQSAHSRNSSIWPDGLSICASATSRKDSGIKSNSRRSSIQHQIYALNQSAISQHRVSGYFTSSTSSISNIGDATTLPHVPLPPIPQPAPQVADPLAACLQQLRKQSDLQLIRCVRDNAKSQRSYLVKPPLKRFSLYFKSRQMERDFRSKAHRFGNENETEGPPTLATPRYNTYIDIFIGIAVYLCISISLFLMTPNTVTPSFRLWVSLFTVFTAIQIFALFLFTRQMCRRHTQARTKINDTESCADRIFEAISSWYPWHICLAILMAMPVILIIANFLLLDLNLLEAFEYHYGFLIFVCIVHFCNFTQLNCWMRNTLALMAAMCFVGIAVSQLTVYSNRTDAAEAAAVAQNATRLPFPGTESGNYLIEEIKWFQDYHVEIYLDLLLILVLVWFLNREFEIGYRLTFYGNAVANQDKIRVQNMKNQADMLLHNIIPKHVAEHLKNTAKYSENHHNVAIIFASIVNFNEMYDESYLGGKEYLRVLNELIGDFDELLSRPEFRSVEKIKTIGSTFMAASGLDPSHRGDKNEHIHALMEFAIAMQEVVDAFNKDLLEFNLILRIGMNIGDVTAGVIGTSKLHYDIWGDAVNVASRMDSTGVPNRIQVGKECLPFLEDKYVFEPRGSVYVKGKDHMEVYLYTVRKGDGGEDKKVEEAPDKLETANETLAEAGEVAVREESALSTNKEGT